MPFGVDNKKRKLQVMKVNVVEINNPATTGGGGNSSLEMKTEPEPVNEEEGEYEYLLQNINKRDRDNNDDEDEDSSKSMNVKEENGDDRRSCGGRQKQKKRRKHIHTAQSKLRKKREDMRRLRAAMTEEQKLKVNARRKEQRSLKHVMNKTPDEEKGKRSRSFPLKQEKKNLEEKLTPPRKEKTPQTNQTKLGKETSRTKEQRLKANPGQNEPRRPRRRKNEALEKVEGEVHSTSLPLKEEGMNEGNNRRLQKRKEVTPLTEEKKRPLEEQKRSKEEKWTKLSPKERRRQKSEQKRQKRIEQEMTMTEEDRFRRRMESSMKYYAWLASLTPEQREERRRKKLEQARQRLKNMSEEERKERLWKLRMWRWNRDRDQKERVRQRLKDYHQRRMEKLRQDPELRKRHLDKMREYDRSYRLRRREYFRNRRKNKMETPEQKEKRLLRVRIRMAKKRLREELQASEFPPEEIQEKLEELEKAYREDNASLGTLAAPRKPYRTTTTAVVSKLKAKVKLATNTPKVNELILSKRITRAKLTWRKRLKELGLPPEEINAKLEELVEAYQKQGPNSISKRFDSKAFIRAWTGKPEEPSSSSLPPVETGGNQFQCESCGKNFAGNQSLQTHWHYQHGPGSLPENFLQCHLCPKTFKYPVMLTDHHKSCHDPKPEVKRCGRCPLTFTTESKLKEHIRSSHPQNYFPCRFCRSFWYTQSGLNFHYSRACNKITLKEKLRLREGMGEDEQVEKLKVKCEFCDRVLSLQNLKTHYLDMHSVKEEEYVCWKCDDKTYKKREYLAGHLVDYHDLKKEEWLEELRKLNVKDRSRVEVMNVEGIMGRAPVHPLKRRRRRKVFEEEAEDNEDKLWNRNMAEKDGGSDDNNRMEELEFSAPSSELEEARVEEVVVAPQNHQSSGQANSFDARAIVRAWKLRWGSVGEGETTSSSIKQASNDENEDESDHHQSSSPPPSPSISTEAAEHDSFNSNLPNESSMTIIIESPSPSSSSSTKNNVSIVTASTSDVNPPESTGNIVSLQPPQSSGSDDKHSQSSSSYFEEPTFDSQSSPPFPSSPTSSSENSGGQSELIQQQTGSSIVVSVPQAQTLSSNRNNSSSAPSPPLPPPESFSGFGVTGAVKNSIYSQASAEPFKRVRRGRPRKSLRDDHNHRPPRPPPPSASKKESPPPKPNPPGNSSEICDICGKPYKDLKALLGHKRTTHNPHYDEGQCTLCGLNFRNKELFYKHYVRAHPSDPKGPRHLKNQDRQGLPQSGSDSLKQSVMCDLCGNWYSPHVLRDHKRNFHNPHYLQGKCTLCGEEFSKKYLFYRHYAKAHPRGRKEPESGPSRGKFQCEVCGRKFLREGNMRTHWHHIHGPGSRPENFLRCHLCPDGKMVFKYGITLQQHLKSLHPEHFNKGKYKCGRCPNNYFSSKVELNEHLRSSHPQNYFPCRFCQSVLNTHSGLNFHYSRACNKITLEEKVKLRKEMKEGEVELVDSLKVKCEFCERVLSIQNLWRHYLDMHNVKEDKYACMKCDKTFMKREYLAAHLLDYHAMKKEEWLEELRKLNVKDRSKVEVMNLDGIPGKAPFKLSRRKHLEVEERKPTMRKRCRKEKVKIQNGGGNRKSEDVPKKRLKKTKTKKKVVCSDEGEEEDDMDWDWNEEYKRSFLGGNKRSTEEEDCHRRSTRSSSKKTITATKIRIRKRKQLEGEEEDDHDDDVKCGELSPVVVVKAEVVRSDHYEDSASAILKQ